MNVIMLRLFMKIFSSWCVSDIKFPRHFVSTTAKALRNVRTQLNCGIALVIVQLISAGSLQFPAFCTSPILKFEFVFFSLPQIFDGLRNELKAVRCLITRHFIQRHAINIEVLTEHLRCDGNVFDEDSSEIYFEHQILINLKDDATTWVGAVSFLSPAKLHN